MKLSATSNQYAFRSRTVSRMETDILPSDVAKQKWLKIHSSTSIFLTNEKVDFLVFEFLGMHKEIYTLAMVIKIWYFTRLYVMIRKTNRNLTLGTRY